SVIRAAHQSLTECIATCFRSAKRVVTSDMLAVNRGTITQIVKHFKYSAFPADALLLGEHEGELVSPARIRPTYVYPPAKRQAICDRVYATLSVECGRPSGEILRRWRGYGVAIRSMILGYRT